MGPSWTCLASPIVLVQEQYTFIYDVVLEAVQCNLEPFAMEDIQNRTAMYKSKQMRQEMEAKDSHEYKVLLEQALA